MPRKMKTEDSGKVKEGSVALLARIRENQRRSRTRRKEYVQHLEQRLRSFERFGVSASQDIQEAGKKVAAENVLLRSLLRVHGVRAEEIKEFLRSQKSSTSLATSSTSANSPQMTTSNDWPVNSNHLPSTHSYGQLDSASLEVDAIETRYSPPKSVTNRYVGLNDAKPSAEWPAALDPVSPKNAGQAQHSDGQYTGQSTSCESAARIVASMRYYSDIGDVRSELGCSSEANCMVKNMSVFDVLDK